MRRVFLKIFLITVLIILGLSPAKAHITPVVHLMQHNAAIKQLIPSGKSFFVRKIDIGQSDIDKIQSQTGWRPTEDEYKFYYGRDEQGNVVGDVLFFSQDSKHGPVVLAVSFSPQNTIIGIKITDATVETVPWIKSVLNHNFLKIFQGLSTIDETDVNTQIAKEKLDAMPEYFAKIISKGIQHTLALQQVLFRNNPVQ